MTDTKDEGDKFAVDVTDAVVAILRATVENTRGPGQALCALTSAVAALQHFVLRTEGPEADAIITWVNKAVENMPQEIGAGLFAQAIRDVQAAREQRPTRFYGEA